MRHFRPIARALVVGASLLAAAPASTQPGAASGGDTDSDVSFPSNPASEPQVPEAIDSSQASGSNATNYRAGASVNVNPRTGAVELSIQLFRIPGRSEGLDATFALSYSTANAIAGNVGVFGLPAGWSTNLSYVEVDGNGLTQINVDGSQSYYEDEAWLSGTSGSTSFVTGMLQYNRADANFRADTSVEVNGMQSADVIATLDGRRRYLNGDGLLIQEVNRFGDSCEYTYQTVNPPSTNELASMTDTWGNTITFDSGTPGGFYKITLPDDRVVSYQVTAKSTVTEVTDAESKSTIIQWGNEDCLGAFQVPLPTQVITPSGGVTSIEYQCMSVCTQDAGGGTCPTTTWPVVKTVTVCPSNPSGQDCPSGEATDVLQTEYIFGGTELLPDGNNYTGYPLYSPFDPEPGAPQGSDVLLVQGGEDGGFTYSATMITKNGGTEARRTVNQYNYLHMLKEAWHCVPGTSPITTPECSGNALSKYEAHCYTELVDGNCVEPVYNANLPLPANYQSEKTSGSCVFPVNGIGTNMARVSTVTREYNLFGQVTRMTKYHGTGGGGLVSPSRCDAQLMFNPSALQVVSDTQTTYDLPATPENQGMFELGVPETGAGNYGQVTSHLDFQYLDEGTLVGPAARGALGSSETPIRVTLACNDLARSDTTVPENSLPVTTTMGLISNTTIPSAPPSCDNPGWVSAEPGANGDVSVAPPKQTILTYDQFGRNTGATHVWAPVLSPVQPGSTQVTTTQLAYMRGATQQGEDPCTGAGAGSSNSVESIMHTDSVGNTTTVRHCTLNGFVLSTRDADGDLTTHSHDKVGLVTRTTAPNGDMITTQYCYRCPKDPNGNDTCTNATPCTSCPACPTGGGSSCGDTTLPTDRSCVIHTQSAGAGNQSFADNVQHATIKDGLGRTVATFDNLGASGGAYSTWQQRSSQTYDGLGLRTLHIASIGVTTADSLSHPTATTYNATFQPVQHCDSHGVAHEIVHDNVGLAQKASLNGNQLSQVLYNDSMHAIGRNDCPLGQDSPATNNGCPSAQQTVSTIPPTPCCPAVSSATTTAECSGSAGNVYPTLQTVDGAGTAHAVLAGFQSPVPTDATSGPPIQSITGTMVRDAYLQKYGYATESVAASDSTLAVSSNATWSRDLNARPVRHTLSIDNAPRPTTSDTYDYDEIGRQTDEFSKLGLNNPQVSFYTPTSQLSYLTDYAGYTFYSYYDNMKRLVRYCYPDTQTGGSEGRKYTHDSITGQITSVTHFNNPDPCPMPSDCKAGDCGDADFDSDRILYKYSRFGALLRKTYVQVTTDRCPTPPTPDGCIVEMSWGYDAYQRPVCFADVAAHATGSSCPETPIAGDFSPDPSTQLAWRTYWAQDRPYRRGLLKSACRGVIKTDGDPPVYETQCTDHDYYTSTDTGGGDACPSPATYPVGALAGLLKTKQVCVGGSCLTGGPGTPVYIESMQYDLHRRPCEVKAQGCMEDQGASSCLSSEINTVLSSTFTYDQYDNVLTEVHTSNIGAPPCGAACNYQMRYVYDGLMRLTKATRSDLRGNPIKDYSYEYDAMSNITQRVVATYDGTGGAAGDGGTGGNGAAGETGDPEVVNSNGGGCNDCSLTNGPRGIPFHGLVLAFALVVWARRRARV